MVLRSNGSLLFLLTLAACTSYGSTGSPATEDNIVEVPELEGRWVTDLESVAGIMGSSDADVEAEDERRCLSIDRRDPPTEYQSRYVVTFASDALCEEPDVQSAAEFTRLGGELIAVLQPEVDTDSENVLLLYNFYRLRPRDGRMVVVAIDADSLRWHLVEHPTALPFTLLDGSPDLLLTATSQQLAEFLAMHAANEALWSDSLVLEALPAN